MRKIRGISFKTEKKIDVMIGKFEEMVTEIEKIKLVEKVCRKSAVPRKI